MVVLKNFNVFLILNLCFIFGTIQGQLDSPTAPPSINWTHPRSEYSRESYKLFCNATGGVMSYKWSRNGKKAVDLKLIEDGGRKITIQVDKAAGYYRCEAKNGLGTALSDIILVGQTIVPTKEPEKYTLSHEVGDYIAMECAHIKDWTPAPDVTWMRGNSKVVYDSRIQADDTGTLHFSYLVESDKTVGEDIYKCHLGDDVSFFFSTEVKLDIEAAVPVQRELILRYSTQSPKTGIRGQQVTLRCIFSGAKDINVEWFNSENKKVEGNRISIIDSSALVIKNLMKSDAGLYTCRGRSDANVKEQTIEVIVDELPEFATDKDYPKDIYATTDSIVEFVCNATSDPQPTVQWFRNGVVLNMGNLPPKIEISPDRKKLTVSRVCKNCGDDAVFQCNASNAHGYAYKNGFLKIYEPTKIIDRPVDVYFEKNKNYTFTCKAETDPETKLKYNWKFNDKDVNSGSIKTDQEELFLNVPALKASNIKFIGKWTCNATNGFSNDKADVYLKERSVAAFPNWWILLLVLLILLLVLIITCCVCNTLYKNRGSVYPVDEIEQKNGNDPEKELLEYGFRDYQRDVTISTSGTLRSQRSMGSTNSLARAS